jgi:hypothetical protein
MLYRNSCCILQFKYFVILCIFKLLLISPIFADKIYVVSPSAQFPPNSGTTASWIRSTDLALTLDGLTKNDTVYLCEGEEFFTNSGPFSIDSGRKITTYPCKPSFAGIKPVLTRSPPKYPGKPDTSRPDGLWVYDLTSYKSSFDPSFPGIWALWIKGKQYYRARFPNLIDPTDPISGVGLDSREFIFVNPYSTPTSSNVFSYVQPMPIGKLKRLSSNYWVNAVLRIRVDNWSYASRVVTSVDATSGKLNMNAYAAYSVGGKSGSSGFYIEHNRIEEVDSPGEYYYDSATYKLYVVPMAGHSPSDTMRFFPVKSSLPTDNWVRGYTLVIRASPIAINGLAIRHSFNGIRVSAPTLVDITDFDVSDILNTGLKGSANLIGCNFSDIGNVAAELSDQGRPRVASTRFQNTGMRDYGFMPCIPKRYDSCKYGQSAALRCFGPCTVERSTFINSRYATVWATGSLALRDNSMLNNMLGQNDGATIEFGAGSVMEGNVIVGIRGNNVSSPSLPVITTAFMGPLVNTTIANNVIRTGYVNPLVVSLTCFRFFARAICT